MLNDLKMAELLCTRLCHDLTGPIGAVNNGAEFLSEEGFNMQGQAVELIVSSAFSAVSRLQFYRLAYGNVKDHGEASLADKQKLVADFFAGSKILLDWPDSHTDAAGVSVSTKMSRLLFNLLIAASGALIRGGTLAVRLSQESHAKRITITANGPQLKWDTETNAILTGQEMPSEVTPKNVQLILTKRFADEITCNITCTTEADHLSVIATQVM